MTRHPEVPFWISVGDLADDNGRYEPVGAPLYWIKGNNENFDTIAAGSLPKDLRFLPNAEAVTIDGVRVVGLGGTFAPSWYETPPDALPHPRKSSARATELADKRRHFVKAEVDRCRAMTGIDVFLSHEAARPYRVHGTRGPDAGKRQSTKCWHRSDRGCTCLDTTTGLRHRFGKACNQLGSILLPGRICWWIA